MISDIRAIARALGGEVSGSQVICPGPRHGPRDRSLAIKISASSPDGFLVHSFAADDWRECRNYVRKRLGLRHGFKDQQRDWPSPPPPEPQNGARNRALFLWRRRKPVEGSLADRYLREARGYKAPIPATLGFLPATEEHPPALIAAFGMPDEPEPCLLSIAAKAVKAVHLIHLASDGLSRLDQKITLGRGALGSPIVVAPVNDGLGLVITEGIEDALSLHEATGLGAWAAGGATRLPALADAVPAYVEAVTISGDDNEAGRKATCELAARLKTRGGLEVVPKIVRGWP
jgi:hypothetical protein